MTIFKTTPICNFGPQIGFKLFGKSIVKTQPTPNNKQAINFGTHCMRTFDFGGVSSTQTMHKRMVPFFPQLGPSCRKGPSGQPVSQQHSTSKANMSGSWGRTLDFCTRMPISRLRREWWAFVWSDVLLQILDGSNRQSLVFSERSQLSQAIPQLLPRGMNVARMNANRAIRITAQRTQGLWLWGLIFVLWRAIWPPTNTSNSNRCDNSR